MTDVAAFDFDGTLTNGGSVFDFLTAVSGRRTVLTAAAALAPRLAHAAVVGGTVADDTKQELFVRVLAGVDADFVDQVGAEFAVSHLAAHVRPEVRRRLDWHRGRGDQVVVVSASPEVYVSVAAEAHTQPADYVLVQQSCAGAGQERSRGRRRDIKGYALDRLRAARGRHRRR